MNICERGAQIAELAAEKKNNPITPKHYKNGKMEAIEIMRNTLTDEEFKGFLKGLIIKYLYRADNKNGLEDYKKAQWYMNKLVKLEEKKKNEDI